MRKDARKMAALGETLRQQGNYSGAIECFNEAIVMDREYWWAYAHRAAARGALGDHCGALDDFREPHVYAYYMKHNPAWFFAQKGELFRLWAMAATSASGWEIAEMCASLKEELPEKPGDGECKCFRPRGRGQNKRQWWDSLCMHAICMFSRAIDIDHNNYWALAHRGAARTMRYWIRLDAKRAGADSMLDANTLNMLDSAAPDAAVMNLDYYLADEDFKRAIAINPGYSWVYLFVAILRATRPYYERLAGRKLVPEDGLKCLDESMLNIGKAQICGLNREVPMVRTMMELAIYMGGDLIRHCDSSKTKNEAEEVFHSGVQLAWQLLQIECDETFARYFVANGLKHLATLGCEHVDDAMVNAAIARARAALAGMSARCLALSGGLDCLEGDRDSAEKKLEELRKIGDLQALTFVSRDPAWEPVRHCRSRPEPGQSTTSADTAGRFLVANHRAPRS